MEGFEIVVNAIDFGAVGDGVVDDTDAVRRALLHASNVSEGARAIVLLEENRTFCTGPLNLTSGMTLRVEGTLQALSWTETDWPQIPPLVNYGNSRDGGRYLQYQAFLYASNAKDLKITGKGIIDGQGQVWWDAARNDGSLLVAGRPNLIQTVGCNNVEVSGVTLKDSPFWCLHPVLCTNVHIHHVTIRSHMYAFNSDGIDPDSSRNVLIEDNDVSCGDDHIAIKAGVCGMTSPLDCHKENKFSDGTFETVNVTIRRNIFRTGMGISLGSECSGGISNVRIEDNLVGVCEPGHCEVGCCGWSPGLHLKTTDTRGGHMKDVIFSNNTVYNTTSLILLETDYHSEGKHDEINPTMISNLSFQNNRGRGSAEGISFACSGNLPCENVTFLHNDFDPDVSVHCENVEVIDQDGNDVCA